MARAPATTSLALRGKAYKRNIGALLVETMQTREHLAPDLVGVVALELERVVINHGDSTRLVLKAKPVRRQAMVPEPDSKGGLDLLTVVADATAGDDDLVPRVIGQNRLHALEHARHGLA